MLTSKDLLAASLAHASATKATLVAIGSPGDGSVHDIKALLAQKGATIQELHLDGLSPKEIQMAFASSPRGSALVVSGFEPNGPESRAAISEGLASAAAEGRPAVLSVKGHAEGMDFGGPAIFLALGAPNPIPSSSPKSLAQWRSDVSGIPARPSDPKPRA